MAISDESLIKSLKFLGAFVLSTLVALFGTAAVGLPISRALRAHTIAGIVGREWILSIVVAAGLGFFTWRSWKFAASRWVWVLPTLWFAFWFILAVSEPSYHSVFVSKNLWTRFSGLECAEGPRAPGCMNWLIFTLPFVRGAAFSIGAWLASSFGSGAVVEREASSIQSV